MSNDLLTGQVVNVMPNYRPTSSELWLIFPSRQAITPAARLFRDALKNKTAAIIKQLSEYQIILES